MTASVNFIDEDGEDRTVINSGSRERMLCNEDKAKGAGWMAPRG